MQVKNCEKLIDIFHRAIRTVDDSAKVDFAELNSKSVKKGYVIHPDCCNRMVEKWLETLTADHNATFYREWSDVIEKDRFQLFVDQIFHYATTYGSGFSLGNGYVPNIGSNAPDFKSLKVVTPVSVEDMFESCRHLVENGVALDRSTIEIVCDFMVEVFKSGKFEVQIDVDSVSCKEAQAYLCSNLGIYPKDEFGILRCLVYRYTNSTSLVKDRETVNRIKEATSSGIRQVCNLVESERNALAKIFFRYKPLILAMKAKGAAAEAVNDISRRARTMHVPFKVGYWESILMSVRPIDEVDRKLHGLDVFRKIRLLQAVKVALYSHEKDKFYLIRNGKGFLRKDYSPKYDRGYLSMLESTIEFSLAEDLSKRACKVKLPKHFNLAVPSSGKSFIGNLPYGTEITLGKNGIIGIYWRNEWGANDIDLSMVDCNGFKIGWNSSYYFRESSWDGSVVYSGDMTNASPEASELLYVRNGVVDGIVSANLFNGDENSKFRLFVATEELDPKKMYNHMVDPNNVRLDTMVEFSPSSRQVSLGVVKDGKFILTNFRSGNSRVSNGGDITTRMVDIISARSETTLMLRDLLVKSGFQIVDEGEDLDLSDPSKDVIVNLLKGWENGI